MANIAIIKYISMSNLWLKLNNAVKNMKFSKKIKENYLH